MKNLFLLLTILIIACSANAGDSHHGMEIKHGWARATPPGASTSAMYMTINNHADMAIKLIGVKSAISDRIEIHNTTQKDGMMQMRKTDGIEIAKNSVAELKPHGTHVMLFDLKNPLKAGTSFSVELIFDNGKTMSVEVPVKKQAQGSDHSNMKSHKHKDQ